MDNRPLSPTSTLVCEIMTMYVYLWCDRSSILGSRLHLAQIWDYWCNLAYQHWRDAISRSRKGKFKHDNPNALVYLANLFFILSSCKCPIKSHSRGHWRTNQCWLFVIRTSPSFLSAYYLSAYLSVSGFVITDSDGLGIFVCSGI